MKLYYRRSSSRLCKLAMALQLVADGAVDFLLLPEAHFYPDQSGHSLMSAASRVITHIPAGLGVIEPGVHHLLANHSPRAESWPATRSRLRAIVFLLPGIAPACVLDYSRKQMHGPDWRPARALSDNSDSASHHRRRISAAAAANPAARDCGFPWLAKLLHFLHPTTAAPCHRTAMQSELISTCQAPATGNTTR